MATQRYCQVAVSWPVDDGHSVEDVVIYNIESDFEEGQMPSSTLDSLTDLFLSPPVTESGDPGLPCTACISVRDSTPGYAVAAVDVLSSARNVEVFSSTGEYLVLAEGTRLDVAGERKLFLSQHTFDQPQPTCDLKFVSLVDPQTLWLHSIHLTLTVDRSTPAFPLAMGPSIDMDKVNAIMADMDADVPDRAKGLMSTMTSMQKNKERAMGNIFGGGGKGPPTMASIMGMFATMGVTSQMSPVMPAPAVPAQPQPKPQQPPQGKAETNQNSGSKNKKNKKGGKKGQKNSGGVSGNAEVEVEEIAPAPKQQQQKQTQPKSRSTSGEQSSQPKGKKQKDNGKKDSEDSPRNESSNKKKSGSNSNNKNSASISKDTNSGTESSKKNSGSDSAQSKKERKGSAKEAKPQQQVAKDTKRSDSVDSQAPVTQADITSLEQRLLQRIDKSEEAILSEVTSQIEASEQRIMRHMESLVSKMASAFFGGGKMVNGGGRMEEDLTPD